MLFWRRKKRPSLAEALGDLPAVGFRVTAAEQGLEAGGRFPNVWCVVMETGYADGVMSFVAIGKGTVGVRFSDGGGVIGTGQRATQRTLPPLFREAEALLEEFSPATSEDPPGEGRVRIYLRTFDDTLVLEGDDEELGENDHRASAVFLAAHDVIAALRTASMG